MDGRVVEQKVRMTAVAVEIRKKESGELVAIGRQWMTASSRPKPQKALRVIARGSSETSFTFLENWSSELNWVTG